MSSRSHLWLRLGALALLVAAAAWPRTTPSGGRARPDDARAHAPHDLVQTRAPAVAAARTSARAPAKPAPGSLAVAQADDARLTN